MTFIKRTATFLLAMAIFSGSPVSGCKLFKRSAGPGPQSVKTAQKPAGSQASSTVAPYKGTGKPVDLVRGLPPVLSWPATGEPKAIVLALHELGMHSGRFENMGERMSSDGISVYAMDLRGFGHWRSIPGKDSNMSLPASLSDTRATLEAIRARHPQIPVFLLGEAMGGALALEAAAKYPNLVNGTISSAPGGEHFNTVSNYLNIGTRIIGRANKDANMARDLISIATPKKELQENLVNDPGVRLDLTARELMSCQFYMYKTKRFARRIETPVMIVSGEKDGESRPEGAERIYNHLSTKDKQLMKVPDGDHYVFEDSKVNDKVMGDTLGWIASRLKKPS